MWEKFGVGKNWWMVIIFIPVFFRSLRAQQVVGKLVWGVEYPVSGSISDMTVDNFTCCDHFSRKCAPTNISLYNNSFIHIIMYASLSNSWDSRLSVYKMWYEVTLYWLYLHMFVTGRTKAYRDSVWSCVRRCDVGHLYHVVLLFSSWSASPHCWISGVYWYKCDGCVTVYVASILAISCVVLWGILSVFVWHFN